MKRFFLCVFFLCMPVVTAAYSIDENEWQFIPEWCDYTQYGRKDFRTNPPKHIDFLINKVGKKNWEHIHHYCMALVNIYRSHGVNLAEYQRRSELLTAIGGIDYVLRNSSEDLIIRPELLTKKGYALFQLKKYVEAVQVLSDAIKEGKTKETYWPAYGYLADIYLVQGQRDKAKEILREGLKVAPSAKGLSNRLKMINDNSSR